MLRRKVCPVLLCALAVMTLASCSIFRPSPMVMARGGKARAAIVVAADASPSEKYAAEELAHFLGQITGAAFKVADHADRGKPRLLVGEGAARLADPAFSAAAFGPDEILLRSSGRDLILAGGRPRGALYAVYALLEDELGCRWWTPQAATIPKRESLALRPLSVRYNPPLEFRDSFFAGALDGTWAARNKCNGVSLHTDERRGGKMKFALMVHTFYPLLPPERYFAAHPEWYSLVRGKRTHERAQLCLTNDAMRHEFVGNLKALLRKNPDAQIVSVSQNDCDGHCQCPDCATIDAAEGSPSGSMLRFVNAVASEIESEFPKVSVITLAYQYTRKPPLLTRPRKNVIVQLCSIECSFREPLTAEANRAFREDIVGWSRLTNRLYIWDYVVKFSSYFYPFPNLNVLGLNVRFFAQHGAIGIFEEGHPSSSGGELAELRAWVLAKLLWNPKLDDQKLVDEFLRGYYGAAAPEIKGYLDLMQAAAAKSKKPMTCGTLRTDFITSGAVAQAQACFEAAERAVQSEPELKRRVRTARLALLGAVLTHWKTLHDASQAQGAPWPFPATPEATQAEFLKDARAAGVSHYAEYGEPDWFKQGIK